MTQVFAITASPILCHFYRVTHMLLRRAISGELTTKWREAHSDNLLREVEEQARALGLDFPATARVASRSRAKSASPC